MADITSIEDVAKGLILAVGGEVTKEHIEGVVTVFNSIQEGINLNWEVFLAEETNEILALDNTECPDCGRLIQVMRTRTIVHVDTQ